MGMDVHIYKAVYGVWIVFGTVRERRERKSRRVEGKDQHECIPSADIIHFKLSPGADAITRDFGAAS